MCATDELIIMQKKHYLLRLNKANKMSVSSQNFCTIGI